MITALYPQRMYMNNTGEEVLTRQFNGRSQQLNPSCSTCIANNMDGRLSIHYSSHDSRLSRSTASHREYNSRSAKTEEGVVIVMSCLHSQGILGIFLSGHLTACSIPPSLPAVSSYS